MFAPSTDSSAMPDMAGDLPFFPVITQLLTAIRLKSPPDSVPSLNPLQRVDRKQFVTV